ncbi:Aldose 1-epimerase precursor [Jeotgalicoccus saudimassiliensis]|uniref:Aldose 1-epimerase n=1 Tax=Jeotgalicoccus saudimassiliensis TaxID=1461582 RepID=A0A078M158_9STAP|nr:aldose epimerase family protein [Jeotgalicoccus saudimassiliensis]CDZ99127.1 Aldose 1-epimerase precursor [Jeotgalicoccus saudimassiliensis]
MSVTYKEHEKGIVEYILKNNNGMTVSVINAGCSITEINVPDSNGDFTNVVLKYESLDEYLSNDHFLGAVIVPVAGRVENASFSIDDETYSFTPNEGTNMLHSGDVNPYNKIWGSSIKDDKVIFKYRMGNEYPGCPLFKVVYSLSDNNELKLEYEVTAESATVAVPTNHTYFNLSSSPEESAENHVIQSSAKSWLKMNESLIPTHVEPAEGLFDLSDGRLFSEVFKSDDEQIKIANGGFDHYFIFDEDDKSAVITDINSGRKMKVSTTFPGTILYTGNNMDERIRLKDRKAQKYAGFCVETQCTPAALNISLNQEVRIEAGVPYKHETVFSFSRE